MASSNFLHSLYLESNGDGEKWTLKSGLTKEGGKCANCALARKNISDFFYGRAARPSASQDTG